MEPRYLSTDEWIRKTQHINTMGYYSALKRRDILTHTTTYLNHEDIKLSVISQTQKEKILYDSMYMRYLRESNS